MSFSPAIPIISQASQEFARANPTKQFVDNDVIHVVEKIFLDYLAITSVVVGVVCMGTVAVASVVSFPLIPIIGAVALGVLFGAGYCARDWLIKNVQQRQLQKFNALLTHANTRLSEWQKMLYPTDLEDLKKVGNYAQKMQEYEKEFNNLKNDIKQLQTWSFDEFSLQSSCFNLWNIMDTFNERLINELKPYREHKKFLDDNQKRIQEAFEGFAHIEESIERLNKNPNCKDCLQCTEYQQFTKNLREKIDQDKALLKSMQDGRSESKEELLDKSSNHRVQQILNSIKTYCDLIDHFLPNYCEDVQLCFDSKLGDINSIFSENLKNEKFHDAVIRLPAQNTLYKEIEDIFEQLRTKSDYKKYENVSDYKKEFDAALRVLKGLNSIKASPIILKVGVRQEYLEQLKMRINDLKECCDIMNQCIQSEACDISKFILKSNSSGYLKNQLKGLLAIHEKKIQLEKAQNVWKALCSEEYVQKAWQCSETFRKMQESLDADIESLQHIEQRDNAESIPLLFLKCDEDSIQITRPYLRSLELRIRVFALTAAGITSELNSELLDEAKIAYIASTPDPTQDDTSPKEALEAQFKKLTGILSQFEKAPFIQQASKDYKWAQEKRDHFIAKLAHKRMLLLNACQDKHSQGALKDFRYEETEEFEKEIYEFVLNCAGIQSHPEILSQ